MAYTRDLGKEFWYDFDNTTLWRRGPAMNAALAAAYFEHGFDFDSYMEFLRRSLLEPNHPDSFAQQIAVAKNGIATLANLQLGVIDKHLKDNDEIQHAFEDFGQGVLYDDRPPRPVSRLIHMMDGTPDDWVGYHRWHAFSRAAQVTGANSERWLFIDRCIALAWAIQTEADPEIDSKSNPGLTEKRLAELRAVWMAQEPEQLDRAFASGKRAPRGMSAGLKAAQQTNFSDIQQLLESAAGPTHPIHSGQRRFWQKPYDEFLKTVVYGLPIIAPPGADRGKRSPLVRVLRGEQENVPQMPLNRPPMSEADIQRIESWIDAGCPDN